MLIGSALVGCTVQTWKPCGLAMRALTRALSGRSALARPTHRAASPMSKA